MNLISEINKNYVDTLIILAGGMGRRMGSVGTVVHKSAMSIFDQSTLQRNVQQAFLAGFKIIIISSHPSDANTLEKLFAEKKFKTNENYIEILSNQKHEEGVLSALLHILETFNFSRLTLSLSDIFFIENPYFLLRENVNTSINILAVANLFHNRDSRKRTLEE